MHMLKHKNLQADALLQLTALCFREIYPLPTISSTQAVISTSGVLLDSLLRASRERQVTALSFTDPSRKTLNIEQTSLNIRQTLSYPTEKAF